MPLLGFLASTTLATSIGRLMEGDAPVSPPARPTWAGLHLFGLVSPLVFLLPVMLRVLTFGPSLVRTAVMDIIIVATAHELVCEDRATHLGPWWLGFSV
jgi:hypothetical protein